MMTNQELEQMIAYENQDNSNANSAQRWQKQAQELERELEQVKAELESLKGE
jgi:hypothetical protein|nr:MAG TPA: protein of unknown function (DUF5320) [Caudoviricetes sp.]